jgi:PAS domain S-box-containing protein
MPGESMPSEPDAHHGSAPNLKTEQNQAGEDLNAGQEAFSRLVAGVRDYAIFLLDKHGYITSWNEGAERIKGYRAEEIVGRHFSRLYPPEAVSLGWPAHELEVAAAAGRFEDEGWRMRKDGSKFWANVVITTVRTSGGEVRGFLKITRDITDRRQAQEKLRLSEERFRLMVEGVEDYAIFMLDPLGCVVTWNMGAEQLKGYSAEEIIGQHFSRFYPQEAVDRGWPDEELRRAAAEGRIEDEGWRIRQDGSRFWANVVITALRDENGTLRGYAKVTRDLTERQAAEENARRLLQEEAARKAVEGAAHAMERQREELRVTLSSIGDAVIVTDMNGNVTFMNAVAADLTGWTPQDAVGQPLDQVFPIINEHTRQPGENPAGKVLREGVVVGLANHTILLTKDGREIPIDDSGAPIRGERGAVAGVVLVFRDVTEARRAAEVRMRLAAIVESSDDAIISKDLAGTITSWNRGAERLYGYTADEIVGKPLAVLVPPDHPDELPAILDRIRRGEQVEHFETERIRKDGRRVDVSLTISPIRNAAGHVIGASKISRDITARKAEDRRKNEFLAMLSHELRNPLAPLRNGLQVMKVAQNDPQTLEETRAMMERQLGQMSRLVDDLLDVSRISQGTIELRNESVSLTDVVQSALETCEPLIRKQHHKIEVAQPPEPLYVQGDQVRLAQVVANILNNAVKYTNAGGTIWITIDREGEEVLVRIRDTGIGIPPSLLTHVFDLFVQVDRSLEQSHGGLGVGLALVKRLVEMHGGTVEASSEGRGKGSEFIVRLPALGSAAAGKPKNKDGTVPSNVVKGRRILVVDDNQDASTSLAMLLKLMGNEVRTAFDGLAAIDAAGTYRPDIMLLDIGMPKLNGYDVCRRIRQEPWGRNITIVALTGWGQEEDRVRSREAGFDGHLVKPVELGALQQVLMERRP